MLAMNFKIYKEKHNNNNNKVKCMVENIIIKKNRFFLSGVKTC